MTTIATDRRLAYRDQRQRDCLFQIDTRDAFECEHTGLMLYPVTIGAESPAYKIDFCHVAVRDESVPVNQDVLYAPIAALRQFAFGLRAGAMIALSGDRRLQLRQDIEFITNAIARLEQAITDLEQELAEVGENERSRATELEWALKDPRARLVTYQENLARCEANLAEIEDAVFIPRMRQDIVFHDWSRADGGQSAYLKIPFRAEIVSFVDGEIIDESDAKDQEYMAEVGGVTETVFTLYTDWGQDFTFVDSENVERRSHTMFGNDIITGEMITLTIREMNDLAQQIIAWCDFVEAEA